MRRIAIALVHHPVRGQDGATVTSAITNMDVHDLARSATTYGASDCFIVSPITAQRELVMKICEHWREGSSGKRIPDRKTALERVRVVASVNDACDAMGGRDAIEMWATAARSVGSIKTEKARASIREEGKPILLLFGTAHGLANELLGSVDAILEPIRAELETGYNHLSVRAACAIVLDRLLGHRDG
jgi:hypothetical protein